MTDTTGCLQLTRLDDLAVYLCQPRSAMQSRPTQRQESAWLLEQAEQLMTLVDTPERLLTDLVEGIIQHQAPYRLRSLPRQIMELRGKAENRLVSELLSDTISNPLADISMRQELRLRYRQHSRFGIYSDEQLNQQDGTFRDSLFNKLADWSLQMLVTQRCPQQGLLHQAKKVHQDIAAWNQWLAIAAPRLLERLPEREDTAGFDANALQHGVQIAHQLHTRLGLVQKLMNHIDGKNRMKRTGMLAFDGHQLMLEMLAEQFIAADRTLGRQLYSRMEPLERQYTTIFNNGPIETWRIRAGDHEPPHTITVDHLNKPDQHHKLMTALLGPYIALSDLITDARKTLHHVNQTIAKMMRSPAYQQHVEATLSGMSPVPSEPPRPDVNDTL